MLLSYYKKKAQTFLRATVISPLFATKFDISEAYFILPIMNEIRQVTK
ncbi:hypothetical protein LP2241_20461 [Pseudolactococcus piscium]|nr:hypothetical protein LP2241_20461 [Lactococcus piscium]